MQIFRDWRGLAQAARGATIALGNFDGVHLGHASVIRVAHAGRPDRPTAVLTFEPHPREFFRPQDPPFRLTLSAERATALQALGSALFTNCRSSRRFRILPPSNSSPRSCTGAGCCASGLRGRFCLRAAARRQYRLSGGAGGGAGDRPDPWCRR